MSRNPPELFSRDLKFLVEATPPHSKRRSGNHSHWLATAAITVLVGVWIGSDPSASIVMDSPRYGNEDMFIAPSPFDDMMFPPSVSESSGVAGDTVSPAAGEPEVVGATLPDGSGDDHAMHAGPGLDDGLFTLEPVENDSYDPDLEWTTAFPQPLHGDANGIDSFGHDDIAPPAPPSSNPLAVVPPSLELATGFEEQQSDIEVFSVATDFDLSALDTMGGSGWNVVDIKKGDTLGAIFKRLKVDPETTHNLVRDEHGKLLNSLQTGPNLKVLFRRDGSIEALQYNIDATRILNARFTNQAIDTGIEHRKITIREREVVGRIRSSLFKAGAAAGLSDQFILRMAAIFKWNIDFNKDLQPGDRFSVVFEEKFIDDRKIATGGIIAAAFMVGGKKYTAVRHVETDGTISYFSADGESLKRAFLRSPVKFSRISSHFSPKRFHPILKKWKAHNGVDYAAGRGTPVLATADGIVALAGQNGGYGKAVILQHGKEYSTLYAHLDRIAKNLRSGTRVEQGEVIGFVGSTGLATGPHLHYEFRVNGQHKNPLTVDIPRALPIAGAEREEFLRIAGDFNRRLTALLN